VSQASLEAEQELSLVPVIAVKVQQAQATLARIVPVPPLCVVGCLAALKAVALVQLEPGLS